MGMVASRSSTTTNTSHHSELSPGNTPDIFSLETRILKRATILILMFLVRMISCRPQTNPQSQESNVPECGSNYCEEVPNYPEKTIIKLLKEVNFFFFFFCSERLFVFTKDQDTSIRLACPC